jgi:5-methylcytosine-specific restriction protein B
MSLEELLPIVQGTAEWPTSKDAADAALFRPLFGSPTGRYRESASKSVTLRANPMSGEDAVRFAAYIEPSNPPSGPYSGMSLVLFPGQPGEPCLISLVLGTNGLHPDEEILGRPGHARKAQAVCAWLNKEHGNGELVAWAKQDPVRTDTPVPNEIAEKFARYSAVFSRYGRELYAIYAPTDDTAKTREALAAFVDLMFAERGQIPLATALDDAERLRSRWLAYLMPQVTPAEVVGLLESRRFVIVEGPPGTGKTRMAEELLNREYGGRGFSIQFHPNTTYEASWADWHHAHAMRALG